MDLPNFKPGIFYFLRGSTANALKAALRMNRPCCESGGGLALVSCSEQGSFLAGRSDGSGGGNATGGDDLPDFNPRKIYRFRKATVDRFERAALTNHTRAVTGSGVTASDTPNGVVLSG
jgi:hypothetical protein